MNDLDIMHNQSLLRDVLNPEGSNAQEKQTNKRSVLGNVTFYAKVPFGKCFINILVKKKKKSVEDMTLVQKMHHKANAILWVS